MLSPEDLVAGRAIKFEFEQVERTIPLELGIMLTGCKVHKLKLGIWPGRSTGGNAKDGFKRTDRWMVLLTEAVGSSVKNLSPE